MIRIKMILFFACLPLYMFGQNLGIIVDDSIIVKSYPNKDSSSVFILNKYDYVKILEETPNFYLIDSLDSGCQTPPCRYQWIKIIRKNMAGWVPGYSIYKPSFDDSNLYSDKKATKEFKFFDFKCKIAILYNFDAYLDPKVDIEYYPPKCGIIMFYTNKMDNVFIIQKLNSKNEYLSFCSGPLEIISGNTSVLIKEHSLIEDAVDNQYIIYKTNSGKFVYNDIK